MLAEEQIFQKKAAECFLQYERYRLKTNVVAINLDKDILEPCYDILQIRVTERYSLLYKQLQKGIESLQKNFILAQATALRALNNIMRDYRRRVGTLTNEPLSHFKYNRFDKSEKMLLESLLYNQKQNYDEILKFEEELVIAMEQGSKQIEEKYRPNASIREDYNKVLEVIDKTECFSYKYYTNFQRQMVTTISSLESYFDKLNAYLTVWENVGSSKAYEVKSAKQLDLQAKNVDLDSNRRFMADETEEKLEELVSNSPPNSMQREQYKRRLTELRHYNMERDKKLQMVGKMSSKRRNRPGILINKRKDVTILDWYEDLEDNKVKFDFQDEFKNYNPKNDSSEFKLTEYETAKPLSKERIDEMKQHSKQEGNQTKNQWLYDRYGKDSEFDLILCTSQQVQRRVEFQMNRQYELQCADDRRKRELFQRQQYHVKDAERRQSLNIGYLYPHEKTEMDLLQQRSYYTDYLPEIMVDNNSSIEFSDQEDFRQSQPQYIVSEDPATKIIEEQNFKDKTIAEKVKQQPYTPAVQRAAEPEKTVQQEAEKSRQRDVGLQDNVGQKEQHLEDEGVPFHEASLQEQIIRSYFKEYSNKVIRKQDEPLYKKSKFLYYRSWSQVPWQSLVSYFQYQKIFIYTTEGIVYFKRVFSIHQEKIKCAVYTLQDIEQELLREKITAIFAEVALVTVKFVSIYPDIQKGQLQCFMIGLLQVLLIYGQLPEDFDNNDFLQAGREIIDDFNYYFYPENCLSSKPAITMKFTPVRPTEVFQLPKQKPLSDNASKHSTLGSENAHPASGPQGALLNDREAVPQVSKDNQKDNRKNSQTKAKDAKIEQNIQPKLGQPFSEQKLTQQRPRIRRRDSLQKFSNFEMQVSLISKTGDQQQQGNAEDDYESL